MPLIPRHQRARPRRRCCDRLPVAPSRAPLARCRWLRPRHLAREAPRLVETVLRSPEDVLLLREAHVAPPRSNRRSASQQLDVAGLSAFCAAVCADESSSCRSTDVAESTFEVGLGFQEELGEVFGYLFLKARMYARSNGCVYAVKFRCSASPGRACEHVRVNRVDHVQGSVLRDPVRRGVGHELARKEWSMRVHSIGACRL